MLKSGACFNRKDNTFKQSVRRFGDLGQMKGLAAEEDIKIEGEDRMQKYYEIDQSIPKIDKEIELLKEEYKKSKDKGKKATASSEAALEMVKKVKTLQNQRKDRQLKLQ